MSTNCERDAFQISGLSFDPARGESNFDCLAIGHCDASLGEVDLANRNGIPEASGWERYLATECDEVAYELAATKEIGVNEFGEHGGSLLMHAVYERHERVHTALARRLFALGADAKQKHPDTHMTPLHLAAALNRPDMANLLIERGADIDAVTVNGSKSTFPTPLQCDRIRREPLRPHVGETPLHLAISNRAFTVARLLLDAGADPNAEDVNGDRPIDYLPGWHSYPDDPVFWRLTNHRVNATRETLQQLLDRLAKD